MLQNRARLILLLALSLAGQDNPVLLRPTAQSILSPGPVEVIARADKVTLDGKPLAGANPVPGVFTGTVHLGEGKHVFAAGNETAEVFVTADPNRAPAGFQLFRSHPPVAAKCDACHVARGTRWALKFGVAAESCLVCHDAGKFPQTHTHAPTVLQDCQLCHKPHGSTQFFHLKFTKEVACKQCHG